MEKEELDRLLEEAYERDRHLFKEELIEKESDALQQLVWDLRLGAVEPPFRKWRVTP